MVIFLWCLNFIPVKSLIRLCNLSDEDFLAMIGVSIADELLMQEELYKIEALNFEAEIASLSDLLKLKLNFKNQIQFIETLET